jgi:hypothetical protein
MPDSLSTAPINPPSLLLGASECCLAADEKLMRPDSISPRSASIATRT